MSCESRKYSPDQPIIADTTSGESGIVIDTPDRLPTSAYSDKDASAARSKAQAGDKQVPMDGKIVND